MKEMYSTVPRSREYVDGRKSCNHCCCSFFRAHGGLELEWLESEGYESALVDTRSINSCASPELCFMYSAFHTTSTYSTLPLLYHGC